MRLVVYRQPLIHWIRFGQVTKHCLRIKTGYRSLLTSATFCQCVQLQPAIKIAIYLLVCCINFSQSAELWYRIIQIWRRHSVVGYYVNGINLWMMYGCQFHNSWNIWCNKLHKHLLQFCTPGSLKTPSVPFTGHPYAQLCEKFVQQTSRVVYPEV